MSDGPYFYVLCWTPGADRPHAWASLRADSIPEAIDTATRWVWDDLRRVSKALAALQALKP